MPVRVLMVGDLMGYAGVAMFMKHAPLLKEQYKTDFIVVNGENSAVNGKGITPKVADLLLTHADVITSGNHIWQQRDIMPYIQENRNLLRPINFPNGTPGVGIVAVAKNGYTLAVLNVQGRVFMKELLACPFRATDTALTALNNQTKMIVVDFHAEATAEKMAFAYYLDGRVSGIVGTHTHVQTADERILPNGTGYITDLGFAGALNSSIGVKKEPVIQNLITQMPTKFEVDCTGPFVLSGVVITIDEQTGNALAIERVRIIDTELTVAKS